MTSFEEYIDQFGPHFNKRLYEWAVSMMVSRVGGKVQPKTKEQVTEFLRSQGIKVEKGRGYDVPYVHAMAMADYYGSSIADEKHLAMFVKDFIDDPDGNESKAFDHFVIDCRAKGEYIYWDELL